MSPPSSPVKRLGSRDLRFTDSSAFIEMQSLTRIQTKLRSSEYRQTTVYVTEKKRFRGGVSPKRKTVCGFEPFVLDISEDSIGSEFTIRVIQKDTTSHLVTDFFEFVVRTEFNKKEMSDRLENLKTKVDLNSMKPARFYRNNFLEHEERLIEQYRGYYEHSRKDHSGHQASPIFMKINGTYFACLLKEESDLSKRQDAGLPSGFIYPVTSPYGGNRRSFDANKILNESSRLFLADMHCFNYSMKPEWLSRPHYPLLIVCQENSSTYHECVAMGLIELDWETNDFLRWNKQTGELLCATKLLIEPGQTFAHDVWPEILVCDTTILIENGLQSRCEVQPASSELKSFIGCKTCGEGQKEVEKTETNEKIEKDENVVKGDTGSSDTGSGSRKRLSTENIENTNPSPVKIPFTRYNSDSNL